MTVTVTVTTATGDRDIPADVLGDELLAVHRTLHGDLECGYAPWTLAHVPTGRAVIRLATREDCLAVGRTLLELLPDKAWRSSKPSVVEKRTPKHVVAWLARCQAAGRRVAPDSADA